MRRFFCLMFLSSIFSLACAQQQQPAIGAIYALPTFLAPDGKPYVEIICLFDANTLSSKETNNSDGLVAVNLQTVIKDKKGDVLYANKRVINHAKKQSPTATFIDVQRVALKNGEYELELVMEDGVQANRTGERGKVTIKDAIRIDYAPSVLAVSDVQLLQSYNPSKQENILSKNGYDLLPLITEFLPEKEPLVRYYAEIYHSAEAFQPDSSYVVDVHIETAHQNRRLAEHQNLKRKPTKAREILLGSIDISDLATGGYYLVVEARNNANVLHAYKKTLFVVRNDSIDSLHRKNLSKSLPNNHFASQMSDSLLNFYIEYLYPIATTYEQHFVSKGYKDADLPTKRNFLYNFWAQRNPEDPEKDWREYEKRTIYVKNRYTTKSQKGYRNDMGRVYLIYGAPSRVIDEKFKSVSGFYRGSSSIVSGVETGNQSGSDGVGYLPYQIWNYDQTPFFERNRAFVFYAPLMDFSDYKLLHSNARGEINDPLWERVLSRNLLDEYVEGEAGRQFRRGY